MAKLAESAEAPGKDAPICSQGERVLLATRDVGDSRTLGKVRQLTGRWPLHAVAQAQLEPAPACSDAMSRAGALSQMRIATALSASG